MKSIRRNILKFDTYLCPTKRNVALKNFYKQFGSFYLVYHNIPFN